MNEIVQHIRSSCFECGEDVFPLEYLLKNIPFDRNGFCIELGVHKGYTINLIARYLFFNNLIHGFDSFEGLPDEWNDGAYTYPKGFFTTYGNMPYVHSNITLHKGWFDETLPVFKRDILKDSPIALLHVDCDLYSSTKTAFDVLGDNIVPGTVIVFDELWNYPEFDKHEILAFHEYLTRKGYWFEPLVVRSVVEKPLCNKEVAVRIIIK